MDKQQQPAAAAAPMTPGQVASNEAARQAVMLIFGVVGVIILMPLYRKIAEQQGRQMRHGMRIDPVMERIEAAEAEQAARARRARKWHRVADVLWPVSASAAVWALRRAESVSKPPGEGGD